MNYLGGYFMLHGKSLYTQIFFNHQPMMAYLSFFIQKVFHPVNIFDLLLRHTQVLTVFGLFFNYAIIRRFRWAGVGFAIVFELTKYYLFGNKFLAESFIVYPMVYMMGLLWYKAQQQKIYAYEYVLTALFTWFVLFTREPYVLAAIVMGIVIIGKPINRIKKIAYVVLIGFSGLSLFFLPIKYYFNQVFAISFQGTVTTDVGTTHLFGSGFFQVFFYPVFLFFGSTWNEFRVVEVGFSLVFCFIAGYVFFVKRQRVQIGLALFILGLTNLRIVPPGVVYYSAFHLIPWFGMFIVLTFLFLFEYTKFHKQISFIFLVFLSIVFGSYLYLSHDFIRMKIDPQNDFVINYGEAFAVGNTVRILSSSLNSFFIDNVGDVLPSYLQSQRVSPYAYSYYAYFEPYFSSFTLKRADMFANNPPDFYYGVIPKDSSTIPGVSQSITDLYQEVYQNGKPSKLYIKKSLYTSISDAHWNQVRQFGFEKMPTVSQTNNIR